MGTHLILSSELPRRHSLERVHQLGELNCWRVLDQEMNMVVLPIHLGSQTCLCGRKERKPLSQRTHRCPDCGLVAQRDLLSDYLGLFVRPEVDSQTGEIIKDTLDLDLASKAWSTGPDVDWLTKPSEDTTKHRVRRQQRPSQRSLERIKARRKRRLGSDRGARQEPLHPSSTARDAA